MMPLVKLHVASLLPVAKSVTAAICAMAGPVRPVAVPIVAPRCTAVATLRSARCDTLRAHVLSTFHSPPPVRTLPVTRRQLQTARRQLTAARRHIPAARRHLLVARCQCTAARRQLHAARCAPADFPTQPLVGPYAATAAAHSATTTVVPPRAASLRFPVAFPSETPAVGGEVVWKGWPP
ncbi:unnamed protein product [Closterium sp. NIES-54]